MEEEEYNSRLVDLFKDLIDEDQFNCESIVNILEKHYDKQEVKHV